jgi:hypothetical protein
VSYNSELGLETVRWRLLKPRSHLCVVRHQRPQECAVSLESLRLQEWQRVGSRWSLHTSRGIVVRETIHVREQLRPQPCVRVRW